MESIPSTFFRYVDVIILYRQDCRATVKLISEIQVLLKRAVFETAAIVMESRDSFPGKFPFIALGRPVVEVFLHMLLSETSTFKLAVRRFLND